MALNKEELQTLYQKRAGNYDISANLYYLIGFRERRYRKMAISSLGLKPGDTVVELGCGTGLNFEFFQRKVGESGRIIGVDLTRAMLEQAQYRVDKHGWSNVELMHSDAARFAFPENINGVFSSFALTLVPEFEKVIESASQALADGGRLVLLDIKQPENWPSWVIKLGIAITRPFGVSLDIASRKPWEAMHSCFRKVTIDELYGGFAYIVVGEK